MRDSMRDKLVEPEEYMDNPEFCTWKNINNTFQREDYFPELVDYIFYENRNHSVIGIKTVDFEMKHPVKYRPAGWISYSDHNPITATLSICKHNV